MAVNNQISPTDDVDLEYIELEGFREKYEALKRLEENEDFKLVVLDGYLKEKAVEFTSLLAVPSMLANRSQIFEALAAVSHFEQYLHMLYNVGAPVEVEEDEDENVFGEV